jgi:hypothetical protein
MRQCSCRMVRVEEHREGLIAVEMRDGNERGPLVFRSEIRIRHADVVVGFAVLTIDQSHLRLRGAESNRRVAGGRRRHPIALDVGGQLVLGARVLRLSTKSTAAARRARRSVIVVIIGNVLSPFLKEPEGRDLTDVRPISTVGDSAGTPVTAAERRSGHLWRPLSMLPEEPRPPHAGPRGRARGTRERRGKRNDPGRTQSEGGGRCPATGSPS